MLFSCAHFFICLHPWRGTEVRRVALACQCKNQELLAASALAAASGTRVLEDQTRKCKRIERGSVAFQIEPTEIGGVGAFSQSLHAGIGDSVLAQFQPRDLTEMRRPGQRDGACVRDPGRVERKLPDFRHDRRLGQVLNPLITKLVHVEIKGLDARQRCGTDERTDPLAGEVVAAESKIPERDKAVARCQAPQSLVADSIAIQSQYHKLTRVRKAEQRCQSLRADLIAPEPHRVAERTR